MIFRLKTKFTLGLVFLFTVTIVIGTLGIYRIYQLSRNAQLILQQNHHSLVYANNMLLALEKHPIAFRSLQQNLTLQQANVTEPGEGTATRQATQLASQLSIRPDNDSLKTALRNSILRINTINQQAILQKNKYTATTASNAILSLLIITGLLLLVSMLFILHFPRIITYPIQLLNAGIREIINKNYNARVHLTQGDEFGELATVFNMMAKKLHEYEHSNLAQIRFEKTRMEMIINQMNDGIIGFDEHKNILFTNAAAARLLGPTSNNSLLQAIFQYPLDTPLRINYQGCDHFFTKEVIAIANEQDMMGEIMLLRNITAYQQLTAAKTKFIATASHELKTPISSMKMSLTLLRDERVGSLHAGQQELLDSIGEDIERILQISSVLLDITQDEVLAIHSTHLPITHS